MRLPCGFRTSRRRCRRSPMKRDSPALSAGRSAGLFGGRPRVARELLARDVFDDRVHDVAAGAQALQDLLGGSEVGEVEGGVHVDVEALGHRLQVADHALPEGVDVVEREHGASQEQGGGARGHHEQHELALDGDVVEPSSQDHGVPTLAPGSWPTGEGWRRTRCPRARRLQVDEDLGPVLGQGHAHGRSALHVVGHPGDGREVKLLAQLEDARRGSWRCPARCRAR